MANYYIEKLADLESNLAGAYYYRGLAGEAMGRDRDALIDFNRAIGTQPDNSVPYLARAGVYRRTGDYRRAVDSCNAALQRNPQDGAAYLQRGQSYIGLEFFPLAIRDFDRSIDLGPSARAYLDRGISHEKIEAREKAAADFKAAAGLGSQEARDALAADSGLGTASEPFWAIWVRWSRPFLGGFRGKCAGGEMVRVRHSE
jgi:tetratricopeptide (TPR) repeat protein